ncbi:NAD(P)H-binding protein [Lactobacillus paragasseri]|uniref:NAD(P)H-binding protein n=1 Tax=Lactobacillus paragasseri TaxID=2107999 RepID=UPI00237FC654|nr:NAD(P)H-binding protein [Lactobacillus paragasseri]MDE3335514.1 NAD(P)H-binding protein [Lactobacillus paragasseri]MDE3399141.1 NAD(P)H-binding protein [Lactobacillus paragasseri]
MAKIFIFGGSGRVATDLIKNLVADGNTITAAARHPENIIKLDGVTAEKLDLHADVDDIAKQVKGFDAIYFTAGSRGKDLIQTDAMCAIKTMMAAEKAGVKRYIMLSSMLSLDINSWKKIPSLEDYLAAKFFADTYLMDSTNLEYTILQPGSLIEEAGTGKIQLNVEVTDSNPIPDVAKTLAAILKYPNTIGKVIPMSSGKTPIDDALKEI